MSNAFTQTLYLYKQLVKTISKTCGILGQSFQFFMNYFDAFLQNEDNETNVYIFS